MNYRVIESSDLTGLQSQVNRLIGEGWMPVGGIACGMALAVGARYFTWAQAMTKVQP